MQIGIYQVLRNGLIILTLFVMRNVVSVVEQVGIRSVFWKNLWSRSGSAEHHLRIKIVCNFVKIEHALRFAKTFI